VTISLGKAITYKKDFSAGQIHRFPSTNQLSHVLVRRELQEIIGCLKT
jgi:hypothetical protein